MNELSKNMVANSAQNSVAQNSAPSSRTTKPKSVARTSQQTMPAIDGMFLWGVFRKSWFWILPAGILIAGVACGVILATFVPTYEARFRLEVDMKNFVVFQNQDRYSREFVDLQRAIILGNSVLEKCLADPALASVPGLASSKDPIDNLRKKIKVTESAGNRLIDVKYANADPAAAARVVNAIVDEYLRTRRTLEEIKMSNTERNVLAALQKAESEVESAKQRVRDLSVQSVKSENVVGEKESGRIDTTYLDNLRAKRTDLQSAASVAELKLSTLEADLDASAEKPDESPATVVVTEDMLDSEVDVMAAASRLEAAKRELKDLVNLNKIGEKNPTYLRAQKKFEAADADYKRLREARRKQLQKESEEKGPLAPNAQLAKVNQLREQLDELKAQRQTVEEQIKQYMSSLKQSSASSVDLQFAESDLEEWNEIRATVHNRRIQLQTERDATDSVRELERAIVPRLPVEELPYKPLIMAVGSSLIFPFLLGVLLEIRSRRVDDANQLESRSQLEVLGEIAAIPVRSGSSKNRSRHAERDLKLFEESVDSLSTTLILRENLQVARVLAVTSALSGEGKTSVSCQLGVSVSRATGKRVLIIDGDMRSPDVHHVFGRTMTLGLVGYLNGDIEWRQAVDSGWSEKVHILSAGHLRGSPHRLLSGGLLEKLLEEAREEYDYIVMDTPPVLPASEALLFAKAADACLVCALRDKSRIEQLIQAYHRLDAAGARVVGSVLSGVPTREYASYYGEYYTSQT